MHGQVLATFVGLQSPKVLPEHDVCLTVLGGGGGEEESGEKEKRRRTLWEEGKNILSFKTLSVNMLVLTNTHMCV